MISGVGNVKVGDPVEESVSERSGSFGDVGGSSAVSVRVEPCASGSQSGVTVGVKLREGKPSVALLFASCLVSKGVGVDGVRE